MAKRKAKPRPRPSDRRLRERVFAILGNSDLDADAAIAGMQKHVEWIKTGKMPGVARLRLATSAGAPA